MRRVALLLATALCLFAAPSTAAHLRFESEDAVAMFSPREEAARAAKAKHAQALSAVTNLQEDIDMKQSADAVAEAELQAAISAREIAEQRLAEAEAVEEQAKLAATMARHNHLAAQQRLSAAVGELQSAEAVKAHLELKLAMVHECADHAKPNDESCEELVDIATQLNNLHWQKCANNQSSHIKVITQQNCNAQTTSELSAALRKLTTHANKNNTIELCKYIPNLKSTISKKSSVSIKASCDQ